MALPLTYPKRGGVTCNEAANPFEVAILILVQASLDLAILLQPGLSCYCFPMRQRHIVVAVAVAVAVSDFDPDDRRWGRSSIRLSYRLIS